mmetsp:Transcript_15823/g.52676  ORF Transcript_15823/g.52676 Transcript_15823/m.52676 type:complete len:259 (+) Transcript_15823:154-930(+)
MALSHHSLTAVTTPVSGTGKILLLALRQSLKSRTQQSMSFSRPPSSVFLSKTRFEFSSRSHALSSPDCADSSRTQSGLKARRPLFCGSKSRLTPSVSSGLSSKPHTTLSFTGSSSFETSNSALKSKKRWNGWASGKSWAASFCGSSCDACHAIGASTASMITTDAARAGGRRMMLKGNTSSKKVTRRGLATWSAPPRSATAVVVSSFEEEAQSASQPPLRHPCCVSAVPQQAQQRPGFISKWLWYSTMIAVRNVITST